MSTPMMSAPSLASRSACERPWPRAMPEMNATLPSSVPMIPFPSSDDRDALDLEELLEARASAFLAEAGKAHPADRPGPAGVGRPFAQSLAGGQFVGEPVCPAQVAGLDVRGKPVLGAVGDRDGVLLGAERRDGKHRPEDFPLGELRPRVELGE